MVCASPTVPNESTDLNSFTELNLSQPILKALAHEGYDKPTPIQARAIPELLAGRDLLGIAQTGTGKTAAFALPILQKLSEKPDRAARGTCRALILSPTRELASQIAESFKTYGRNLKVSRAVVFGGVSIGKQVEILRGGVDVLVATPGRLVDLIERRAVTLNQVEIFVLDEVDQMLDLGFIHALRRIAPLLPKSRQTMLFSATMPKQMAELAAAFLTDPVRVEVNTPGKPVDKIEQSVHFVAQKAKTDLLIELLDKHRDELALVFGRTKHGCEKLYMQLEKAGFAAASIHGNKSQGQRERAISDFCAGRTRVLVATDVAARGIDIPGVRHVYNYDLPNVPENYVHRIGRTARAGADGAAIAFCAPDEMGELKDIQKAMKATIPVASGAPWEGEDAPRKQANSGQRRRFGAGGGAPANTGAKPAGAGRGRPAAGKSRPPRRAA